MKWLSMLCSVYVAVWLARLALARRIASELRPLYLPAVVGAYVFEVAMDHHPWNAWRIFGFACGVANYWLFKGDDDDRWKRRRKKLAEKIEQRGTRLVVVPAGGGS